MNTVSLNAALKAVTYTKGDRVVVLYENDYYLGTYLGTKGNLHKVRCDDSDLLTVPKSSLKGLGRLRPYKKAFTRADLPKFLVTRDATTSINWKALRSDPESYLYGLSESQLGVLVKKCKAAYYNTDKPLVPDEVYDAIEDELKARNPNHPELKTGAEVPVSRAGKVTLPYPLGSLNKVKPGEGTVSKYTSAYEGPYVVSDKLDGQSLELVGDSKGWKLYTRGSGTIGQDVSHLASLLKLPPAKPEVAVRAEFIMSESNFTKLFKEGKNARNSVSGVLNKDKVDRNIVNSVDIVVYKLLSPKKTPSAGLKYLKTLGFKVVPHKVVDDLDDATLAKYYEGRRTKSPYKIDGIVVEQDRWYPNRQGNPDHAVAFKMAMADQAATTKVVGVEWNISRHSHLVPTILVQPVDVAGVTIRRLSGFNYKFIVDNRIGKGAVVKITRSGDVIPDLRAKDVLKPGVPNLPDVPYVLTDSGVHAVLSDDSNNEVVAVKKLTHFFRTLGVEDVSQATITKLYDDNLDTIIKIIKASPDRLQQIDGIQSTMANKIYNNIQGCLVVTLPVLMDASGCFERSFGTTRASQIVKAIPKVLDTDEVKLKAQIMELPGFNEKTTNSFLSGLPEFKKFFKLISKYITLEKPKVVKPTGSTFKGQSVLFTGVRSKSAEDYIVSQGGSIASSITRATLLITKDMGSGSSKMTKAKELGIKIMTLDMFNKKYGV